MMGKTFPVCAGAVMQKSSWVGISPKTDYEQAASWLSSEIKKVYSYIMQKANFQSLKKIYKDDVWDTYHLYFIKNLTPEVFPEWIEKIQNALTELQEKRKQLEAEQEVQKQ